MASGRQDWSSLTVISGKYGTSYLPVMVDDAGQLYAVLKGTDGTSYIPIKLDADGNLIARIKGMAGSTITDVKVDTDGQMYVRIMGLEGVNQRQLAVDADGRIESLMKGNDAGTIRTLAVDASGYLIALLKGDDSGTIRTLACDEDGLIKVNLSGQGLDYLKVRPTYGPLRAIDYASVSCVASDWSTLATITGRGVLFGGGLWIDDNCLSSASKLRIKTDNLYACDLLFWMAYTYPLLAKGNLPLYGMSWLGSASPSAFGLMGPIPFDTELKIQYYNVYASVKNVACFFTYALVP